MGTDDVLACGSMATGLREGELRAWRAFLRAHHAVTAELDAELGREQDLPLGSYEVLLYLASAPDRALRMSRLAERVMLSRSGLTRLVDRLEAEGLVERLACPTDARGHLARLTAAGALRLRRAAPVHLRGVRQHFVRKMSDEDLGHLADLLEKIAPPEG